MADIGGETRENNVLTECTVRLYRVDDGTLVSEQQSVGGSYLFTGLLGSDEFYVVCIGGSSVCPQISGILTPV